MKIRYLLLIAFWVSYNDLSAQIDHYWSWNFNTSSALVSGAVVGGNADVSSIYYNPALISSSGESQLALNASLFTVEWLNHENAFGRGFNVEKKYLKIQPRFISFTGSTKKGSKFEFAFFTKNADNFNLVFNNKQNIDLLSRPEGEESYTSEIQLDYDYVDRWFGFGISDKTLSGLSYGLTTFVSVKDYRFKSITSLMAFSEMDSMIVDGAAIPSYVAGYSNIESLKTWNGSILWKGGLHYQLGRLGIGVAVTTPSIYVTGSSESSRELSRINIYNSIDQSPVLDSAFVSYQSKANYMIRDPFSVSFGLEYTTKRENGVLFSMEYFHKIDNYQFTEIEESDISATNSTGTNRLRVEETNLYLGANSVLNFAFGFHYLISESFSALGGVRTDFSNMKEYVNESPTTQTVPNLKFDIYHLTFGGEFHVKQLDFVAGVQYSRGREKDQKQIINVSDPFEYIPSTGEALQGLRTNTMNINYNAMSFFIGLTFNFLTGSKE